jgi:hypothetical protein
VASVQQELTQEAPPVIQALLVVGFSPALVVLAVSLDQIQTVEVLVWGQEAGQAVAVWPRRIKPHTLHMQDLAEPVTRQVGVVLLAVQPPVLI